MKRRLLFLLPSVPVPADSGAKLRNLMLLRLAAEDGEVHALAFGEAAAIEGIRLTTVPPPPSRSAGRRMAAAAKSKLPDMAWRLWSPAYAEQVRSLGPSFDLVQAEGIEMARYLDLVEPQKRVYDAHNAEFLLQRRASEQAGSVLARLYSRLQWRRLQRFEGHVMRTVRLTLAVSEHDANQLRALASCSHVHVVRNGIDVAAFPYQEHAGSLLPTLLFLGKMDYRPNSEAVQWLLRHVLPAVLERLPEARLFVVGANPPRWLVHAGQHDPRIAVTGHVPDERPYLARSSALALPLRVAGGTRLKALIAMSSGLAIVSSRAGMEGLEAVAGEHYVQAETTAAWATALPRVLSEAAARQHLTRSARQLVERCYDWPAVLPMVRAAYEQLV